MSPFGLSQILEAKRIGSATGRRGTNEPHLIVQLELPLGRETMKQHPGLMMALAVTGLLVFACQVERAPEPSPTPPPIRYSWLTWISDPACRPPCWNQITPGVTTLKQAEAVMEKTSGITITQRSTAGLDWEFGEVGGGGFLVVSGAGIVAQLTLKEQEYPEASIQTIVDAFGDPSYVIPSYCREGMCLTHLVYPHMDSMFSVLVENEATSSGRLEVEITPDTVLVDAYFYQPGTGISDVALFEHNKESVFPWKGYGRYPP
jgi:hypothetical protein